MPKVSLDVPEHLLDDLKKHVGDERKFVSVRRHQNCVQENALDQLDRIDHRHGRIDVDR